MTKGYSIVRGGMHDRFMHSRSKVQFIGGGFGNGKTAAVVVKALELCKSYPGSNGLIARSTYPKLNDSIRKEFFKWCPRSWVTRMPTKDDNTCVLTNGTTINFRYVAQRGKNTEGGASSNLLSNTYDWVIVDQIEDPEFAHKDFLDLMGRLRGNTPYEGTDKSMPKVGPQWIMLTANPTRNWVYRELVHPLHQFQKGILSPKLICAVDMQGKPILDANHRPVPLIELFEGSTYENVDNVGEGFITAMMSTYTGVMRDRYILGKWGALSGLVYPQYDESVHVVTHVDVMEYFHQMRIQGFKPTFIEAYDHGIAAPSCYLLGFVDDDRNVFIIDGFHRPESLVENLAKSIRDIRAKYNIADADLDPILADPAIFRRHTGGKGDVVGATVANMFEEEGIEMQRANNAIYSGIGHVQTYLASLPRHEHPIIGHAPAPHLYFCDNVEFVMNEITEYYWKSDSNSEAIDTPNDKRDHAMDTLKYLLTHQPKLAKFIGKPDAPPAYLAWHEIERQTQTVTKARHK